MAYKGLIIMRLWLMAVVLALALPGWGRAGRYYSGETFAELPSQWRGFLLDHRMLASIASAAGPKNPESPARKRYLEEARKLEEKARTGQRTADELADLGALYVRLGEPAKAVAL